MVLTRAVDNRLKQLFMGGEVRWGDKAFQGKGFRSLGQEAIYAGGIRLRRGPKYQDADGRWNGDVLAPVIRDLGVTLAMRHDEEAVRQVLSAQMGKAGPPMFGKDLHTGDWAWGVLPAAAPLSIGSLSIAGLAMGFWRQGTGRVAFSFIGEGGSSLGEWHEAINLCAVRKLPAVFCLQNNQTALSTPVPENSAARVFADKAAGYGIPGITIDGTDPDAVAAAFTWAAERARAGLGPTLIELVAMRMCGHAHHDDMLYHGKESQPSWEYPPLHDGGYANREHYEFWSKRDPIARYAAALESEKIIKRRELDEIKRWAEELVEQQAQAVIAAPWPEPDEAGHGVFKDESPRVRVEVLDPGVENVSGTFAASREARAFPALDSAGPTLRQEGHDASRSRRCSALATRFAPTRGSSSTARMSAASTATPSCCCEPLLKEFGDRILNSPLAEGAVLGVCVGAALAGQRPIGEMQFNDFVATGFNQLVNNAAKIRYRWGGEVPMVVRMPWGGLRSAGPYHSQNTEAVVLPHAGAEDRRAVDAGRRAWADGRRRRRSRPGALLRAHRALPRSADQTAAAGGAPGADAHRQGGAAPGRLGPGADLVRRLRPPLPARGRPAQRRRHRGRRARSALARAARQARDTGGDPALQQRADRARGLAHRRASARASPRSIQEEAFEWLDAPVRILGALDTPVPYAPPLEEFFLVSEAEIEKAARLLRPI